MLHDGSLERGMAFVTGYWYASDMNWLDSDGCGALQPEPGLHLELAHHEQRVARALAGAGSLSGSRAFPARRPVPGSRRLRLRLGRQGLWPGRRLRVLLPLLLREEGRILQLVEVSRR